MFRSIAPAAAAVVLTLCVAPALAHADRGAPVVTYTNVDNDCLTLQWDDPSKRWDHYTVYHVITSEIGAAGYSEVEITNKNYVYCGADGNSEYIMKVQACEDSGVWPWESWDCSGWIEAPTHYFTKVNWLGDGGFENWTSPTLSAPWDNEGTGARGVDLGSQGKHFAHSGSNNAWIRTAETGWNAIAHLALTRPNTYYRLSGWIRSSGNVQAGYFGVRGGDSNVIIRETKFGPLVNGYQRLQVDFYSGNNGAVRAYVGFWGPGSDAWIQIDDLWLASQDPTAP